MPNAIIGHRQSDDAYENFELKLTPGVVRSTLWQNLIKTIKWSVELSADFLEPFYVDVGDPR